MKARLLLCLALLLMTGCGANGTLAIPTAVPPSIATLVREAPTTAAGVIATTEVVIDAAATRTSQTAGTVVPRVATGVAGIPKAIETVVPRVATGVAGLSGGSPQATPVPIPWPEAEAMILNGQVRQVTQLHSREVRLRLKDGREVVTTEPTIDDVFRVIQRCGNPCSDISVATE